MAHDAEGLLAALRRGDQDAFRRVAERELTGLYAIARGILGGAEDAEDACQEVLFRLHRASPGIESEAALRAWLRRVCVNYCLDERRRSKRRPSPAPLSDADELPRPGTAVQEEAEQVAFHAALWQALSRISPRQRAVFVLRHFQGCSTRQTAEILGCAEGTVQSLLSRAMHALRELLSEWNSLDGKRREGERK